MLTFFVTWMLVTLASAVGLLAFLAFDQWQVAHRSPGLSVASRSRPRSPCRPHSGFFACPVEQAAEDDGGVEEQPHDDQHDPHRHDVSRSLLLAGQ
jgi:hypothetical protein